MWIDIYLDKFTDAPDKIAKFKGFKDHQSYASYYWMNLKRLASANTPAGRMEIFADSPFNVTKFYTEFLGIDTVINLLFF